MDTILFYGDQDEATRRQVRSVAAQYSHRIGPRKRKKSKILKQSGPETKRGHYKKLTDTSDVSASSSNPQQQHQFQKPAQGSHPQLVDAQAGWNANAMLEAQHRSQRDYYLRREHSGSETCPSSSEVGSEPAYSPHTPQMEFVRRNAASLSPHHPHMPSRRLPAYTWTEYPRYANRTGPASPPKFSASDTAAKRLALELPDPKAITAGLPTPPRSHPMDMQPRPQPTPMESVSSDHMPSLKLEPQISGDERAMSKEETAHIQPSAPPPLQISRCATEVKESPTSGDQSRWRSGAAESLIPSTAAG